MKMNFYSKLKFYSLVVALSAPLYAFAENSEQPKENTPQTEDDSRIEVSFKQRHSRAVKNQDLYVDGIKIKRDLSLIEKVQESRMLSADEIPADDLYGGVWSSSRVNAYEGVSNVPDTFSVDLSNFYMPTMGHVTSNFGKRRRRMHYGIDLKVQIGDTIYAAFDGKVRLCQFDRRGYGNYVVMRHPNGLETVYGHLSKFLVNEEDVVRAGDPIALGGNTGRSSGSHLHLEFRFLGKPIDPNKIVDFDNKVCHRDFYTVTPQTFNYMGATSSPKYARSSTGTTNKYVSGQVAYHRVRQGDSLYKIAQRYGTSVKNLCRLNGISEKTVLRLGQTIRLS